MKKISWQIWQVHFRFFDGSLAPNYSFRVISNKAQYSQSLLECLNVSPLSSTFKLFQNHAKRFWCVATSFWWVRVKTAPLITDPPLNSSTTLYKKKIKKKMWHLTPDTWHVTHDMWHIVGGEHYLKISAPQLIWFGIDSGLKKLNKRITYWINELIIDKCLYRTAPATPCLILII